MAAIETYGLTKRYGEKVAVENLNLKVAAGEIYGFLGPNGAGKSTTINLLLNFLHPTDGEARVLGFDTREDSYEIRRRVGILPEAATAYEHLTGQEHLEFAEACKNVDADIEAILNKVGLSQSDAERTVGEYSKGMAQRLGLGMALVGDPDILILDEPSSGLDPSGMRKIRDMIRDEAANGTAVFFSSHILPEVEAVCDRVGILRNGELVAQGTIDNLRETVFSNSYIEVTLRTVPANIGLESIDGVQNVDIDGSTLHVICANPTVKADVVAYLHEQADVTEIISEPTSLKEMFEAYTAGERTTESDETSQTEPGQ